jgi:hypothetical protein
VADGVIAEQPCRIKGTGTPQQTLGRVLDVSERLLSPAQVAAVAGAMPAHFRLLVLAAAWSGLRQGELLALTLTVGPNHVWAMNAHPVAGIPVRRWRAAPAQGEPGGPTMLRLHLRVQ